jgi:hypothetical protein
MRLETYHFLHQLNTQDNGHEAWVRTGKAQSGSFIEVAKSLQVLLYREA